MQVEIVGKNSCGRWHQDQYVGRATVSYTGPGTWLVDDESVQFDQFQATRGTPNQVSDPLIVPDYGSIHRTHVNSVVLIKGNSWPGITGVGVTHKSPNVPADENGNPVVKRLMLKVDLSMIEPGV